MSEAINKAITEFVGDCWHDFSNAPESHCPLCGVKYNKIDRRKVYTESDLDAITLIPKLAAMNYMTDLRAYPEKITSGAIEYRFDIDMTHYANKPTIHEAISEAVLSLARDN